MTCFGCQLAQKQIDVHVVYETEHLCCILDHDPFNEGHLLLLPKTHVLDCDELNQETAYDIMDTSILLSKVLKNLYRPDGIVVHQANGIFNDLTHYHMHLIPRYKNQVFTDFFSESVPVNETLRNRLPLTCEAIQNEITKMKYKLTK